MANRKKKRRRTGLYLVVTVVVLFIGSLVIQGYNLNSNCDKLAAEQVQLEAKKKSLEKEKKEIEEQTEYRKSDKYIEDVAREKFGLVYDNEIVFKAAE